MTLCTTTKNIKNDGEKPTRDIKRNGAESTKEDIRKNRGMLF